MRAIAFVKSILDPEAPPGAIRFDAGKALGDVPQVLGPYEGNALELAVQIAEASQGEFRAVALGGPEQEAGLRKALALGAAQAMRVDVPSGFHDPLDTARQLKAAADALGGADVYLFGRQAGDWDQGVTAGLFAGLAGLPLVPLVQAAEVAGAGLKVRREIAGGYEEGEIAVPCVLSASNGPGTLLRLPKVKDVMLANRKPIELRAGAQSGAGFRVSDLKASVTSRAGRRIEGDLKAQAEGLAQELRRAIPGIGGGA
ncbi:MAG: electron transfer flavoprotein subunit beta/FixA family protein [Thermaerobacter sp.]|nr:electron transfer flavoprotein subunit beta/FixA family protein [Thermaerobacter sp.]